MGSLTIASNASATPATVSLTGTGVVVTLAASPGGLTYVAQQVGTASASQPVTLSNPGGASISVSGIQASGDFAQTNNCGASVAANSSCTVNVTFTPTASGSRTGTLTITDAASNSPQSVSLTGSGIAPTLSLSTTSLYFGTKVVGTSSPGRDEQSRWYGHIVEQWVGAGHHLEHSDDGERLSADEQLRDLSQCRIELRSQRRIPTHDIRFSLRIVGDHG